MEKKKGLCPSVNNFTTETTSNSHRSFVMPPTETSDGPWGGYYENGRLYHSYNKGKYLMPCDEDEQDRLDIYHKLLLLARRGALHTFPFTAPYDEGIGPLILDWGTGTGIWAIEMADKYLAVHAKVIGLDLALTQPPNIPSNLTFLQGDIDSSWDNLGKDRWDLIHIRMLNGGVSYWQNIYEKVYSHLKPEHGRLEHTEIDLTPRCNDGSLPASSALHYWNRQISEASKMAGRSLAYNGETELMLIQCGYVDIQEQIIETPLNPWPTAAHAKELGKWYNLGLMQGLQALSMAPLTRMMGWSVDEVNKLCNEVRKEISCNQYHVYHNIHIWNARRPT
ncbi:Secondary metabolism regulator LAE1 [Golovinomyces cichoracearum]|uniref:Secondary metabolism regulator LAE1 n=1 Tax=Golovinomyces cichoracearum TaxID=62708 RepID=A0A420IAI4_9PEZI|nr:Secondary metabolism regulator LAE1 [Golovinomyces cichoracearum]